MVLIWESGYSKHQCVPENSAFSFDVESCIVLHLHQCTKSDYLLATWGYYHERKRG